MAKPESVFPNFDFTKMMKDFDASKFDVSKIFKDFKFPGVDVQQVLDIQRKNLEAFTSANQLASEGIQALAKRQAEIAKQTLDEAGDAMKQLMGAQSPEQNAATQADLAKHALERAMSNMRELAELAAKSNSEAFDVINRRLLNSMDELKNLLPKQK